MSSDLSAVIVKAWGHEYVLQEEAARHQLRVLVMRSAGSTSLHRHHVSHTWLVCIDGEMALETESGVDKFGPGAAVGIDVHEAHRLSAVTDCLLAELLFPYEGSADLERLDPSDSHDYFRGATTRPRSLHEQQLTSQRRKVRLAGGHFAELVERGDAWPPGATVALSTRPPGPAGGLGSDFVEVQVAVCFGKVSAE